MFDLTEKDIPLSIETIQEIWEYARITWLDGSTNPQVQQDAIEFADLTIQRMRPKVIISHYTAKEGNGSHKFEKYKRICRIEYIIRWIPDDAVLTKRNRSLRERFIKEHGCPTPDLSHLDQSA